MKPRRALAAAGAAILLLTACGDGPAGTDDAHGTDVVGTWGNPTDSSLPTLEFTDDGSVTGTDGCNRLMGGWTVEGGQVVFDALAGTMMACPDVDTWLSTAARAEREEGILRVFGPDGEQIGTLAAAREGSSGSGSDVLTDVECAQDTTGRWNARGVLANPGTAANSYTVRFTVSAADGSVLGSAEESYELDGGASQDVLITGIHTGDEEGAECAPLVSAQPAG
ncbi:META domain-containing protein [Zafaria sp. J156]|uniref:META domain-containing protein n=1 Tax=Zafaria sp. J156 TaxID=3116490 RepID=UPI002E790D85|nr:META domain-containing protein [Zafaria sp. J156]MEE1620805.1 META domain-containing protein [Zafaria sp. J156]